MYEHISLICPDNCVPIVVKSLSLHSVLQPVRFQPGLLYTCTMSLTATALDYLKTRQNFVKNSIDAATAINKKIADIIIQQNYFINELIKFGSCQKCTRLVLKNTELLEN